MPTIFIAAQNPKTEIRHHATIFRDKEFEGFSIIQTWRCEPARVAPIPQTLCTPKCFPCKQPPDLMLHSPFIFSHPSTGNVFSFPNLFSLIVHPHCSSYFVRTHIH